MLEGLQFSALVHTVKQFSKIIVYKLYNQEKNKNKSGKNKPIKQG